MTIETNNCKTNGRQISCIHEIVFVLVQMYAMNKGSHNNDNSKRCISTLKVEAEIQEAFKSHNCLFRPITLSASYTKVNKVAFNIIQLDTSKKVRMICHFSDCTS